MKNLSLNEMGSLQGGGSVKWSWSGCAGGALMGGAMSFGPLMIFGAVAGCAMGGVI